jgi:hypothetical protein
MDGVFGSDRVMAVNDRTGELHLGGKQAIHRIRSVIRKHENADATIEFEASPDEVTLRVRSSRP